jgi:hypothetical protein
MTIDRASFFNSTTGSSTNTTSTFNSHLSLTFTPKVATPYFVMASSITDPSGAFGTGNWRLQNTTANTTFATAGYSFSEGGCSHGIAQWTSSTAVSTTFSIENNCTAGTNVTDSFGSILVVEQGANDISTSATGLANITSPGSGTTQTLTFSVPSTGNYLLIAYAEAFGGSSSNTITMKMTHSGVDYGTLSFNSFNSFRPWSTVVRKSLPSGSNTITIGYTASAATSGGDPVSTRNARIIAIRMDAFYNEYYIEARTPASTGGSIIDVAGSTLTQTTQAFDHITIGASQFTASNSPNAHNIVVNGATKGSSTTMFSPQSCCYFFPWKETLSAASHTSKFQYENGSVDETAISMFQVTGIPTFTNGNMFHTF